MTLFTEQEQQQAQELNKYKGFLNRLYNLPKQEQDVIQYNERHEFNTFLGIVISDIVTGAGITKSSDDTTMLDFDEKVKVLKQLEKNGFKLSEDAEQNKTPKVGNVQRAFYEVQLSELIKDGY